ncbi:MAG: serine/threonine protein kinase [Xanthomonadales bacterium]|nr:serine/threonine protein kinase [Xanthomonadales bacterium]
MSEAPGSTLRAWFEAALEQPTQVRSTWLEAHCTDSALRAQVQSLLANAHKDIDATLLDHLHAHFATADASAEHVAADWSGRALGSYRLQRCIGEGGMSVVYLAQRLDTDDTRPVAVKILRIGMHAEERQKAFRREREALSRLDHPSIARLIDGGIQEGLPYLVIDYVDGQPLTTHARAQALPLRARLGLFATVCRAVESAHRQLVVHRDIKPSNVFLRRSGRPMLLDFGIAKLLDSDEATTRTTHIAFTPDYAAPEQLANDPVSTATDVFALGVVLHELLTGVRPERGWTTRPSVIATRIGDDELPAGLQLRALRASLVGDLDNVILKAIDPDPQRRYGSAGAFADDIDRYLDGRPVSAHPHSRWYRTRKFVQRHRGAVSLSAALAVALVASLAVAVQQGREASQQAQAAQRAAATARSESARANAVRDYLLGIFKAAQEQLPEGQRPTPQQLVQAAAAKLETSTDLDHPTRAALYAAYADISSTMSEHADAMRAYARAADLVSKQPQDRRDWLVYNLKHAYSLNLDGQNGAALALAAPLIEELRALPDEAALTGLVDWTDILVGAARFDEAIDSADDVAKRAARLPDRPPQEARFLALLPGWVRVSAGRPKDAVIPLQRALDAWRASSAPKDTEFAGGLTALSVAQYQLGRKDEARVLLEEALALSRTIFKAPHERLASLIEDLSLIELQQGNLDAAARHAADAIAMSSALFGPAHPRVLSARLSAATIDWDRIGVAHAIAEYRAIAEICATSGQETNNPDCPRAWRNLGNALVHVKQLDQALLAGEKGQALTLAMYGAQHNEYGTAMAVRATIIFAMKRYDEALLWNDRALAIFKHNGTDQNILGADLHRNRVASLRGLKRYPEALAALAAAAEIFERYAPNDLPRQADMVGQRALIHAAQGQSQLAEKEAREALQLDPDLTKCFTLDRPRLRALATPPG